MEGFRDQAQKSAVVRVLVERAGLVEIWEKHGPQQGQIPPGLSEAETVAWKVVLYFDLGLAAPPLDVGALVRQAPPGVLRTVGDLLVALARGPYAVDGWLSVYARREALEELGAPEVPWATFRRWEALVALLVDWSQVDNPETTVEDLLEAGQSLGPEDWPVMLNDLTKAWEVLLESRDPPEGTCPACGVHPGHPDDLAPGVPFDDPPFCTAECRAAWAEKPRPFWLSEVPKA